MPWTYRTAGVAGPSSSQVGHEQEAAQHGLLIEACEHPVEEQLLSLAHATGVASVLKPSTTKVSHHLSST